MDSDIEELPAASTSTPAPRPHSLNLVEHWLVTSNQQPVNSDDYNDTTMPTWGLSGGGNLSASFDYGAMMGSDSDRSDAGLPTVDDILGLFGGPEMEDQPLRTYSGSDLDSDLRSDEYAYELPGETEISYTSRSGSEADIDTGAEAYPELD
ncbi:hypothetical protein FRC11_013184, partial [Ceratobasidium sp. 423]